MAGAEVNSAQAVHQLLEREAPDDYLREASEHYAAPQAAKRGDERSALVFRIGPEWLALPTTLVDEAADPRARHSLPQRRSGAALSIVNVRGELLACVSLRALLGIEAAEPAVREARLLVLRQRQRRLACPVDQVDGILRYDPRALQPPPATLAAGGFTRAMLQQAGRSVGLLDEEPLLRALERSLA